MSPIPFLSLAGLALLSPLSHAGSAVGAGDAFPPLRQAELVGQTLPPTAGKVLLIDFWASWCAPCKASFPAYARLNAEFAPRGLVIVAVGEDRVPAAYASFVAKLKPPFCVVRDSDQGLVAEVQVPTMPTSYLVDREGRTRYLHPGFHGADTERALRTEIEALLAEIVK